MRRPWFPPEFPPLVTKEGSVETPDSVRALFSSIASRYDLANHLLSGGLDFFWRRRAAAVLKPWAPGAILDLATGSGDLALTLRARFPEARIVGTDFCYPMLARARAKGLASLVAADGLRLPFAEGSFDAVTVAFGLRNMSSWPLALREMRRVLREAGHILILDFSIPPPPWRGLYRAYLHYCLPRLAGVLTGERTAYEYLADSIERFPAGEAMRRLIEENGFAAATAERLTTGIVSLYTARRA